MELKELSKILKLKSPLEKFEYAPHDVSQGAVAYHEGKFYFAGDKNSWPHEACHVKLHEIGYPCIVHTPMMGPDVRAIALKHALLVSYDALTHPLIWQLYHQHFPGELAKEFTHIADLLERNFLICDAQQELFSKEVANVRNKTFVLTLSTYGSIEEQKERFEDCRRLLKTECKEIDELEKRWSPVIARYVHGDAEELLSGFEKDIKYLWSELGANIKIARKHRERTMNGNEVEIWDFEF